MMFTYLLKVKHFLSGRNYSVCRFVGLQKWAQPLSLTLFLCAEKSSQYIGVRVAPLSWRSRWYESTCADRALN